MIYPVGTEIIVNAMIVKHNNAAMSVPSVIVVLKTGKKPHDYSILLNK